MAVVVSMALVVAAIVVGLHVQLGLSLALAAVAGLSLFVGLVGFQAWRRGEAERAALADELSRLEAELGLQGDTHGRFAGAHGPAADPARPPVAGPSAPAGAFGHNEDTGIHTDGELPGTPAAVNAGGPQMPHFQAYRGAPAAPQGQSFADYWSRHPAEPPLPAAAAAPDPEPPLPAAEPSAVREDDVEMLQRRIKDMLHQVTAAEQARDLAGAMPAPPPPPSPAPAAPSIERSIEALQAAALSMRQQVENVPAAPAPVAADDAVREAIAAGRVDVFLEPILALGTQATQHYEVSIRLTGSNNEDLGTGEGEVLTGRGLLPLFDAVRIERSAIVAERLHGRGKSGAVFSRASGESLIEPEFTRNMQMDFVARPGTARQLILTFAQADIRSFRAAEQRSVSALSALGFRFAIAGLTDLDMNFAAMAQAGFAFVKIDAAVMMHGLPQPGGHVPASDVCRFLADQGFGLIVEGIDSEETLAKIFGFGVLLGQGTLFGGRRPVKADVAGQRGQAA